MKSLGRFLSGVAARLARPVRAAAASRWGAPLARAAAAALGLVLLGAIGRSTLAGAAAKPMTASPDPGGPDLLASGPSVPPPLPTAAAGPVAAVEPPSPVSFPTVAAVDAGEAASSRGRASPEDPVFLNQATLADLRRLPGVGAKRAQAILALRDRLRGFKQIEDLLKVKGIGRSSLKKLRPIVRLDLLASPPDAGPAPPPMPPPP